MCSFRLKEYRELLHYDWISFEAFIFSLLNLFLQAWRAGDEGKKLAGLIPSKTFQQQ